MLPTVIDEKWRKHIYENAPFIGGVFLFAFMAMAMLGVLGVSVIISP